MTTKKPKCKLTGADGNIFNLMAIVNKALLKANLDEKAKEMRSRIARQGTYEGALSVIMKYVEVE